MTVKRYDEGDVIPVVTADANCYNGVLVKFDGNVDAATGYPTVVIGTANSTDIAGVVDCGRVDGKAGTPGDKYASGSIINVRRAGIVTLIDSGSGTTAKQYANCATGGKVAGTATFDASANVGRIINKADASGNVYVALTLR